MKRLILVMLALLVFIGTPVCAYTLLDSYTSSYVGNGQWQRLIVFSNHTAMWDVTKIIFVGDCTRVSSGSLTSFTATDENVYMNSNTSCIAGTVSVSLPSVTTVNPTLQTCEITATLNLIDPGTCAGTGRTLTFVNSSLGSILSNNFRIGHNGVGIANSSHPYYAAFSYSGEVMCSGVVNIYSGSDVVTPISSFTCAPTSQYPDTDVVCTDTSINTPTDWYWTLDAEAMGIDGWQTSTSQNFTWQSHYPGLYSVNLRANNSAGFDWENKTNYVSISDNATPNNCNIPVVPGLIRSWAQCVDSQTSGAIDGCDLSLYDLEGGAWSNVTDRFDGTWCIDTYPGHHFHAYGSAVNYTPDPTYRLNLPVSSSVVYELLMHPGYVPPAATGKVWLYVIVNDADTGASLSDAHVLLSGSGETSKSDYTDSTGSVHIQWTNVSTVYITASKAGYVSGSKTTTTSAFGPDTVRIELHKGTVTPTATMTTGPGGTVPTTLSPWQNQDGTYKDGYSAYQGQEIMNLLAQHGYDLVLLCILFTMFGLVKMGMK